MIDLDTITDREIFDAIRHRKGGPLTDEEVRTVNGIMYPPKPAVVVSTWDRQKLEDELTRDEGKRLRAYKDTKGKWTIGIGHNLDDCGTAPLPRTRLDVLANGINEAENDLLFDHDIKRAERDLDNKLSWWRKLDPVRQRVLLNMCFNMGIGDAKNGLCSFANTLGMIERGEYPRAAAAMLNSKWARQVGMRARRLSDMMRDGR